MMQKVVSTPNALSAERLTKIKATEQAWGRDTNNILESNSDPRNITAKFPVYLASYANGDWGCNTHFADDKIDAGSLPDLVAKMNAASGMEKADATAAVVSEMVTQRKAMRDGMMKMQQEMMGHMMEHMEAGKDSMASCPMMKQMGGMK